MIEVPAQARRRNLSPPKGKRERCHDCGDTGLVVVVVRHDPWRRLVNRDRVPPGIEQLDMTPEQKARVGSRHVLVQTIAAQEEYGPCPYCEQGLIEEFPDENAWTKSPGIAPPWGPDGFWRGTDAIDELASLEPSGNTPLSREENFRRLREFQARLGYIAKDVAA